MRNVFNNIIRLAFILLACLSFSVSKAQVVNDSIKKKSGSDKISGTSTNTTEVIVCIMYTVEKDSTVSNLEVVGKNKNELKPEIVEEAMRIVRTMKIPPQYNTDGSLSQTRKMTRLKFTKNADAE